MEDAVAGGVSGLREIALALGRGAAPSTEVPQRICGPTGLDLVAAVDVAGNCPGAAAAGLPWPAQLIGAACRIGRRKPLRRLTGVVLGRTEEPQARRIAEICLHQRLQGATDK